MSKLFKSTGVPTAGAPRTRLPKPVFPVGPRPPTATPRNTAVLLLPTNVTLPKWQTPISSGAVPDPSWCQVGLRTLATQVRQAACSVAPTRTSTPGRLHSGRWMPLPICPQAGILPGRPLLSLPILANTRRGTVQGPVDSWQVHQFQNQTKPD